MNNSDFHMALKASEEIKDAQTLKTFLSSIKAHLSGDPKLEQFCENTVVA